MILPQLTLLDTNIVQNLQTFGEFIYDYSLSDDAEARLLKFSRRTREDLLALQIFMGTVQRSGWPLMVSDYSMQELAATRDASRRLQLQLWAGELAAYSVESGWDGEIGYDENRAAVARTLLRTGEFNFLPDRGDRLLVLSALTFGCDIFLTMDYRTIWRFRDRLTNFGLSVMRPVELTRAMRL